MKRKLYTVALAALFFVGLSHSSSLAQVGISIGFAPPAIPIYTQPYPPGPGYIWTPGYWALVGGVYVFHRGYWGPHVGYYGGINYGYGYLGSGYSGGRWEGGRFVYNTAVSHVNTSVIRDTYHESARVEVTSFKLSHSGAPSDTAETAETRVPQHRVASAEPHRVRQSAVGLHEQEPRAAPELRADLVDIAAQDG